jgi:serine/threonine-protein kinase
LTPRETRFVSRLLEEGTITPEQGPLLEESQARLRDQTGEYRPIWELAVDLGMITRPQAERVRRSLSDTDPGGGARPEATQSLVAEPSEGGEAPRARHLGKYQLISKLGQGGMGAVYKAHQEAMDRVVALKVLPRRLAGDQEFTARFLREARAAGRLNHPNVVAGIDAGFADGYYYFAMEYVEGRSLGDRVGDEGPLPEREVLAYGAQVARALAHAHAAGIVHRDVKPENILVTASGQAKLCDLGLARTADDDMRVTQAGMAVGTPFYISPEQVRGREPGPAADVYSLGCTLYHLATGRPPFDGANSMEVMQKHLRETAVPITQLRPELSRALELIVARMMAREPAERYASAAAAAADLEKAAAGGIPSVLTAAMAERRKSSRDRTGQTSTRTARVARRQPTRFGDEKTRTAGPRRRVESPVSFRLVLTGGSLLVLAAAIHLWAVILNSRDADAQALAGRRRDGANPPVAEAPPEPPGPGPEPVVGPAVTPGQGRRFLLQDGLETGGRPYAGTRDSYVSTTAREFNVKFGGRTALLAGSLTKARRSPLVAFTIFHSEGGPVPDGAEIASARLMLWKIAHYPAGLAAHELLKPWDEGKVCGAEAGPGAPWAAPACSPDGDYTARPVGTYAASAGKIGWVEIDVTESLRAWSAGRRRNHGWIIHDDCVDKVNIRRYHSSEYGEDPSLRPKLEVTCR